MNVVLSKPGLWYLLKQDDDYLLDVHCEQSFVSFTITVALDQTEYEEFHALGRTFLDYLAEKINYWPRRYADRHLSQQLQTEVLEAIRRWQTPAHSSQSTEPADSRSRI